MLEAPAAVTWTASPASRGPPGRGTRGLVLPMIRYLRSVSTVAEKVSDQAVAGLGTSSCDGIWCVWHGMWTNSQCLELHGICVLCAAGEREGERGLSSSIMLKRVRVRVRVGLSSSIMLKSCPAVTCLTIIN